MIRVYGTSHPEIQDVIRRFKQAVAKREPVSWKLLFNKKSVQHFNYDGKVIKTYAIYTDIGDERVELGFMEQNMVNYIERNKCVLNPVYRGGDIIVKGMKDGKKVFSYEPLKVTKKDIFNSPFKVIDQINQVATSMLQEGVEVIMEQKLFGLGFELESNKEVPGQLHKLKNFSIKR